MPRRKMIDESENDYLEELDTEDGSIIEVSVTLDPEPLPEVAKPVQLSPYEGCVIWGSWRGSGEGWWEVTDGRLHKVADAHQLHPWKKRLDHLPGNVVPSEMELA